jgi:Cu/Ag efflux pump CusA
MIRRAIEYFSLALCVAAALNMMVIICLGYFTDGPVTVHVNNFNEAILEMILLPLAIAGGFWMLFRR